MTPQEAEDQAREYIDRALDSQRALGHESTLTDAEYRRAVERAAQAFVELVEPAPDESESAAVAA